MATWYLTPFRKSQSRQWLESSLNFITTLNVFNWSVGTFEWPAIICKVAETYNGLSFLLILRLTFNDQYQYDWFAAPDHIDNVHKKQQENSGIMVAAWANFESGKWGGHGGGNISCMCLVKCLFVCQQTVAVFAFIYLFPATLVSLYCNWVQNLLKIYMTLNYQTVHLS